MESSTAKLALYYALLALVLFLLCFIMRLHFISLPLAEHLAIESQQEIHFAAFAIIARSKDVTVSVANISEQTVRSMKDVTDPANPESQMTRFNRIAGVAVLGTPEKAGLVDTLGVINGGLGVALFGVDSRHRGLLAVTENAARIGERTVQIEDQVSDALPMFLDCDSNPDCLFNRYQGSSKSFERTMQATERTMQAVEKATPEFTASVNGIAANTNRYVDEFTRPKGWKGQTGTLAKAGFLVCRLLC